MPEQTCYVHIPHTSPMDSNLIHQYLDVRAEQHPETEAIVIYDPDMIRSAMTYRQLKDRSMHLAASLVTLGLSRGQHVILIGGNTLEYVVFLMALHRLGAHAIILGPGDLTPERTDVMLGLGCAMVAYDANMKPSQQRQLWSSIEKLNTNCQVTLVSIREFDSEMMGSPSGEVLRYATLLEEGETTGTEGLLQAQAVVQVDDPIVTTTSSGSTGVAKLVQFTTHCLVNIKGGPRAAAKRSQVRAVSYNDRPIAWVSGLVSLYNILYGEMTSVWAPVEKILTNEYKHLAFEIMEREKCTASSVRPFQVASPDEWIKYDLNIKMAIFSGRCYTPDEIVKTMEALPGANALHIYGASEAMKIATRFIIRSALQDKASLCKLTLSPGVELKIIDDKGCLVPRGEMGEICVRNECVFMGYLGQEETTKKVKSPDGWIRMGDLGVMDEEGRLQVLGRKVEVIKKASVKIVPGEIEASLMQHPLLARAVVIGVPDQVFYQEICACVEFHGKGEDASTKIMELDNWCIEHFPPRANGMTVKPKYFVAFKEFPTTVTGKIDLYNLRKRALEQLSLA